MTVRTVPRGRKQWELSWTRSGAAVGKEEEKKDTLFHWSGDCSVTREVRQSAEESGPPADSISDLSLKVTKLPPVLGVHCRRHTSSPGCSLLPQCPRKLREALSLPPTPSSVTHTTPTRGHQCQQHPLCHWERKEEAASTGIQGFEARTDSFTNNSSQPRWAPGSRTADLEAAVLVNTQPFGSLYVRNQTAGPKSLWGHRPATPMCNTTLEGLLRLLCLLQTPRVPWTRAKLAESDQG